MPMFNYARSFFFAQQQMEFEFGENTYVLSGVTNYDTLCNEIEGNLDGAIKALNLKITYKNPTTGKEYIVKNDKAFNEAKQQMKQVITFTCTPIQYPVPQPNTTGLDAARCKCGIILSVSQPQNGQCSNQGCVLQASQKFTQLWSCQNDTCGYYCLMCVQTKLKSTQPYEFENDNEKNKIFKIREEQEKHCKELTQFPPNIPFPSNILGLDAKTLKKLDDEVIEQISDGKDLDDAFISDLCERYKLDLKKQQLIGYIKYPTLPKFTTYQTKSNIVDLLVKKKLPTENKFNKMDKIEKQKEFGDLSYNQLEEFQVCYDKFKAITFEESDLFLVEERNYVLKLKNQKSSFETISETTLISINLAKKILNQLLIDLKFEKNLFGLFRKHSQKTDDEVNKLIIEDGDDLVQLLLQIYKEDKEDYHVITKTLGGKKYAINFENSELSRLLILATRSDLDKSPEHQKEALNLFDFFLNKDLIVYLMVLHDFTNIENNFETQILEQIILDQQHKDLRKAVVQLLILEQDENKKNKAIESKEFQDSQEQAQFEKLEKQMQQYFIQQIEKQKKLEPNDQEQVQGDEKHVHLEQLKVSECDELVKTIQVISNITGFQIQVFSKSNLTINKIYIPEAQDVKNVTLNLVRDDLKKVYHVMIKYENKKKIINSEGLKALIKKYQFLSNSIPDWLNEFIQLSSLRMYLKNNKADHKNMFQSFFETKKEMLKDQDDAIYKKLYDAALKFKIDSQLVQEWFFIQQKFKEMDNFCIYWIERSTRILPNWIIIQYENYQKNFPMNLKKYTLQDFNRVQTYQDPNLRKKNIKNFESEPEKLTPFIINTLFGVILRKADMSLIQNDIQQIIKGENISIRFLVSYLLQSADMGLRARLNYYLCQNKSVPLIMNCQQTFIQEENLLIYNHELVFSIQNNEGVGVFAFGVGQNATNPCGKSEISNLIVTPKYDLQNFDEKDSSVFSNGQIDVFFEKCFQDKRGWAFMDGQGKIPVSSLFSVLHLTNIVLIHFFEKDSVDKNSLAELLDTVNSIKDKDSTIQVCLILRDCSEILEINKIDYPDWIPCKEKIDKLFKLSFLSNQYKALQKTDLIQKIIFYFNNTVDEINSKGKSKFTKQNFLDYFCKTDSNSEETQKRIADIFEVSKDFIQEVQVLKENVFNQQGLPSLKIKDQIREISLKLRQFESLPGETQKDSLLREVNFQSQLKIYTEQLSKLEINKVMQQFWKIVNHLDAVLIKIEVAKSLQKFTQQNIEELNKEKQKFLDSNGKNSESKNEGGLQQREDIQKANDIYKQKMKGFEDEIFQRSLSYEYFWRSLICLMDESKQCNYWTDNLHKESFKNAVRQQMLDGDTFELIDGRNLEMKAEIIKQIVGYEIESTKCIVVCVIGPQSTGKSTLMNFCFGTQFLASTGRCTQGIYFTLQRIPPEMKKDSDVDYLIILDTEGLNSPERAEFDRPDSEYDRKIVLFTLLCSDFLIINSSGDMSLQMKELIKICAVRYDELRAHAKAPKILYTFVKNSDCDSEKFKVQIKSLYVDVIDCSDTTTIANTANELLIVNNDSVKVLGNAYENKSIEIDSEKGILNPTHINVSAPQFGIQAANVWLQVQDFIQSGQHQFRQIGAWLQEAGDHWSLIDKQGANITQFGNVAQMKNDRKIKTQISLLWQNYIDTQITSKDNNKAAEKCKQLYDQFKEGQPIEILKKKFIKENDEEKEKDYQDFISAKYNLWVSYPGQNSVTVGAEIEHMKVCKNKLEILKSGYNQLIEDKFTELTMSQVPEIAYQTLFYMARILYEEIKKFPEGEQDKLILEKFQPVWNKLEQDLTSESQIDVRRKQQSEYLSSTFKSVNKFMPQITQVQFQKMLAVCIDQDMYPNSTLPKRLVDLLVNQIRHDAFMDETKLEVFDTLSQFSLNQAMLGMLIEDPKQRIFSQQSDAVEQYLHLQKMLEVEYTYFIINNFERVILQSSVFDQIATLLKKQKDEFHYYKQVTIYGQHQNQQYKTQIDDQIEIVNSIYSLFQELGQAGYGLETKGFQMIGKSNLFESFKDLNVQVMLQQAKIWNNPKNKTEWVKSIKDRIKWDQKHFKYITPRVQSLLHCEETKIPNQLSANISYNEHYEQSENMKKAAYTIPEPKLSYHFAQNDTLGKIDVKKFLTEKKLDDKIYQFYQCLVRPKQYDMSDSNKWTFLSELANAAVDWEKIVLDINKDISPEIQTQEIIKIKSQDEKVKSKIDLQSVLERSLLDIQKAEFIQNQILQTIKNKLDFEVSQKLSLYVSHKLSGVITWVGCVIIWYKLQKNVVTIFQQEIDEIKTQRLKVFKRFSDISKGITTATTRQFAEEVFNQAFNKFNDKCISNTRKVNEDYLQSNEIKEMFDTSTVYKQMDETYINQPHQSGYQKCIEYVTSPVRMFTTYVSLLKQKHIVKYQEVEFQKYQGQVLVNLLNLKNRLQKITQTMKHYDDQKDQTINFFEVMKDGKKVDDEEEKNEIMTAMSFFLINTLRKILDGTYTVEHEIFTLNINCVEKKYSFSVKQNNPAKKGSGSPYNDLQKLRFDETSSKMGLLNEFLVRLDLLSHNTKYGVCTDLRHMVDILIDQIEQKESEIQQMQLENIRNQTEEHLAYSLYNNAIGCKEVCKFCNRKCELAPHSDDSINHNCNKQGHQLRVFGGGTLVTSWGDTYPSLTTCDEIKTDAKIRIVSQGVSEVKLWSEIHNAKNRNWTTNQTKFLSHSNNINPVWVSMYQKLEQFWRVHGQRYCNEKNYKHIEPKTVSQLGQKASQLTDSQIVIICLDDSGSMFNTNSDFDKAVAGGKQLEQYLRSNHLNPSQIHIQLWFNDCHGVNRVYKGQLSSTIPSQHWKRTSCQGDKELNSTSNPNFNYGKCGQFQGAIRILNKEVNDLLARENYTSVHWFFFTDGGNTYPHDELNTLQQTLSKEVKRWTHQGHHKLHPMIITNQTTVQSLCQMKQKIDQIIKDIWQVDDACVLKQNVKIEKLAETMIESFTF